MLILQYRLSVAAFVALVFSVILRSAVLRRQGIKAMNFGVTDKTDFVLIPCVLFVVYILLANAFRLPIAGILVLRFWQSELPGWIGLTFCLLALVFFIYALVSFGKSFRVGIDEQSADALITTGAFAISRNPIYLAFLLFLSGLFLIHSNPAVAIALLGFYAVIRRQIKREEEFLESFYGEEYREYQKRVRRFL